MLIYLSIAIISLTINVIPDFMPATWMVLSFFYIRYHLSLFLVVLIGAIFAAIGRYFLAILSGKYFINLFPAKMKHNFLDLGEILNNRAQRKVTIPLILGYMFIPIPSNQLFIAAGLSKANLSILVPTFFVLRLFTYSISLKTANLAINNINGFFSNHFGTEMVIINIINFAILIGIGSIPWHQIALKLKIKPKQ